MPCGASSRRPHDRGHAPRAERPRHVIEQFLVVARRADGVEHHAHLIIVGGHRYRRVIDLFFEDSGERDLAAGFYSLDGHLAAVACR